MSLSGLYTDPPLPHAGYGPDNLDEESSRKKRIRNLAAFWLLGLTNNFGYVVMLSAANDILTKKPHHVNHTHSDNSTTISPQPDHLIPNCNPIGTGAILLADILPALFVKLTAPFYVQYFSYFLKVGIVVGCSFASFPIVATSQSLWQSLLGVAFASFGSGLGEITYLSLSSFFDRNVISTWGSGTGMAGVAGALIYAGVTSSVIGLSPRNTLFAVTGVSIIQAISYYIILVKPSGFDPIKFCKTSGNVNETARQKEFQDEQEGLIQSHQDERDDSSPSAGVLTCSEKLSVIKVLLKYMIPLGMVYFAEYFINQALFELIQFENTRISIAAQYRWYQVLYQVGVFISRSSLNVVKINKIWILVILQFLNVGVLLTEVIFQYVPSVWLVFILIGWEGLLGGAAYVNTFYKVSVEMPEKTREFSMGVVSVADSFGIAIAGFVSIPVHNALCTL